MSERRVNISGACGNQNTQIYGTTLTPTPRSRLFCRLTQPRLAVELCMYLLLHPDDRPLAPICRSPWIHDGNTPSTPPVGHDRPGYYVHLRLKLQA